MKLKRVKYERKNEALQATVDMLYAAAKKNDAQIWKRVATDLLKPTRSRTVVNLGKIDKFYDDKNTVVVCGKVLGYGEVGKKVEVVAHSFSDSAKESIKKAGGNALSFEEFVKKNPKGSNVKILE
jgi:large subunit ribosomal protein L18e